MTGASALAGQYAIVTGGSRGIGRAIVGALAHAGATVAFTSRQRDADADAVLAGLPTDDSGARGLHATMDVRDGVSVQRAVATIADRFGRIDLLVNNAGTNVPGPALELDESTWDLVVDTNLKGLFFTTQAVAKQFRNQRETGDDRRYAVVNIASQMGLVGAARRSAYCASKAGVINLTRALAVEWAPLGIRVNAVAPTFVHTPLADAMLADPVFRSEVESGSPMGQIGEPEDVAEAVLYLSSPAARLVTGHTLAVDGGWTAW